MEPLQAAIQKAREARAKTDEKAAEQAPPTAAEPQAPAADTDAAPAPVTAPPTSSNMPADWAALTPFAPSARTLKRNLIVAAETGVDAAPYDMLRTRLLQQTRKNGWKRVLITSPDAGCGKSTISTNLAASLARNSELRTILFDLDLRRPAIAKFLGYRGADSFHQVLDGSIDFADQAITIGDNLAIATNQTPARHSSELLQSDSAAEIIDQIEKTYQPDIMLFDMPPLSGSDDTHAFLRRVDCCILVAAAESTTVEQIDTCEQELASQSAVLGVVLNKCRYSDAQYGYNYSAA